MIKEMTIQDFNDTLLTNFKRHQVITEMWVDQKTDWNIQKTHKIRKWDQEKRQWLLSYLKTIVENGGVVIGVYKKTQLIAFSSIENKLIKDFINLSMFFVDDDYQHQGIGSQLFYKTCLKAKDLGATQLYISSIPAKKLSTSIPI